MKQIENVYEALRMLEYVMESDNIEKSDLEEPVKKLRNFVLAQETAAKTTGKVDLKKWCSNEKARPVMCNVAYFTKTREAVACDLTSLIISKQDYFDPMPGAVLNQEGKDGEFFQIDEKDGWTRDLKYPDYRSVIPQNTIEAEIEPREVIVERLRQVKAALRYDDMKGRKGTLKFKVGPWWFRFDQIEKMLSLPGWGLSGSKGAVNGEIAGNKAALYRDENYEAMFMPVSYSNVWPSYKGIEGVVTI